MPLNLIKTYPSLLELNHLNEFQRKKSLRSIFDRDVTNNEYFLFLGKVIRPIKVEGILNLDRVFNHLITEDEEVVKEDGTKFKRRVFEKDRAHRLHWLKHHVDQKVKIGITIFSIIERDQRKRKDVTRTYIYNTVEKYVVVLEPQNSQRDYYLLSAYHLNKKWAVKQMKTRMKNRLDEVY